MNAINKSFIDWPEQFEQVRTALSAQAFRLTNGNREDAEDLVQDAICRVLKVDPSRIESHSNYLLKTMRNLWFSKHVKRQPTLIRLEDLEPEDEPFKPSTVQAELENEEHGKDLRNRLLRCMRSLNHRERELIRLHLMGYTIEEIAAAWGEDLRIVRSDLNAVRSKVRYSARMSCLSKEESIRYRRWRSRYQSPHVGIW